jgi:ribose transport system ATP-binding protein
MVQQPALLSMQGVSKRFGATAALRGVDLSVRSSEALALIGENGAGKSTLMKILSGAMPPDEGSMELAGRPFQPRGPLDARRCGVAMIYQELNLALDLSVEDNIMLGQERGWYGLLNRRQQRCRMRAVLDRLGHPELEPDVPVRCLSVGARQLVEIARALAMQAKLIVFDEPTSSLTRHDTQRLFGIIDDLRSAGIGVIYISHFLEEVRRVCSHYTVLRDGAVTGRGRLSEVDESQIVGLMVGRSVDELFPRVPHQPGDVVLELDQLRGSRQPRDVTFQLRRGEILGIGGLIGSGRTELLRCLYGLDPVKAGQVRIGGGGWPFSPDESIAAGLGMVSEDRKGEGLAQARSIADNLTYSRLQPYQRYGWLNLTKRQAAVEQWIEQLQIKTRGAEQPLEQLSGGNQQKVAIARVLHQQAQVLLLDEPTRGIDVGTKAMIYRLMGQEAAAGKAIVFVSSYFPELLHVCDRIGVMSRGRLREIRPASAWTEEELLRSAIETHGEAE